MMRSYLLDRLQQSFLINSGCWGLACAVSVRCTKSLCYVAVNVENATGIETRPGSERSYVMLLDNWLAVTISAVLALSLSFSLCISYLKNEAKTLNCASPRPINKLTCNAGAPVDPQLS